MDMVINKEGFSLVEILIVIAIIGILAVVTVVALKPQEIFANGRNSRRVQDINSINTAIGQWLSREGINETNPYHTLGIAMYTPSLTPAGTISTSGSTTPQVMLTIAVPRNINPADGIDDNDGISVANISQLTDEGYLASIPSDPISGNVGYRVGVDDVLSPSHIYVCTGDIEFTSQYTSTDYPNNVFCASN